jgi:hypothetical protein
MKNQLELKIFSLSAKDSHHELLSIMGDKFNSSLPFSWELTNDLDQANVVFSDGFYNDKFKEYFFHVVNILKSKNGVLVLHYEMQTLLEQVDQLKKIPLENIVYFELVGADALPEEILSVLNQCHEKLKNV